MPAHDQPLTAWAIDRGGAILPGRIAFLLPNMGGGGTERLTVDLMEGCLKRGHAVDLVLAQKHGVLLDLVPEGARVIGLGAKRLRDALVPLRRYLKEASVDGLIAAMWPLTIVAIGAVRSLARRPRLIVSDHCSLVSQYAGKRGTLLAMRASLLTGYRFADGVVGVSSGVSRELAALAALPSARVTTIFNPVGRPHESPVPETAVSSWGLAPGPRILTVGSFKPVKNHALLIRAFAALTRDREAVLAIVGEGPERAALERQVVNAGLADKVILPGFTLTPGDWYASADLFVLSSDYEGFGNVLIEAMHYGLPVVSTDCPSGPAELLGNGRWGGLVPLGDATALAAAMRDAIETPQDRDAQIARAADFGVDRAVDAYLRLLFPA